MTKSCPPQEAREGGPSASVARELYFVRCRKEGGRGGLQPRRRAREQQGEKRDPTPGPYILKRARCKAPARPSSITIQAVRGAGSSRRTGRREYDRIDEGPIGRPMGTPSAGGSGRPGQPPRNLTDATVRKARSGYRPHTPPKRTFSVRPARAGPNGDITSGKPEGGRKGAPTDPEETGGARA